jgi:hypothetical protein
MKINQKRIKRTLYFTLHAFIILIGALLLSYGMMQTDWHDFEAFYHAAQSALAGTSIYTVYTVTGEWQLPFWYLPWTAWFYIPFAVWPITIALILYKGLSIVCAIFVVNRLCSYYELALTTPDKIFIFAIIVPLTLQLMIVGQMDYLLLSLIVITMFAIDKKQDVLAGLIFPFLWIKPHLLIVFTLFAFWRAGKRAIFISAALSAAMLILETVFAPGWIFEMLNLLRDGTHRTASLGFTTLPNLLGSQENWVGTANIPFTLLLIIIAILIVWKFRNLPTVPLLTLALTASLFCAPRAHAYDLTLLIPALIWLTAKKFTSSIWIWVIAATIPLVIGYGTNAYISTLFVFILSVWKANQTARVPSSLPENIWVSPT